MTAEVDWWHQHGYLASRELEDDVWLTVSQMLFTYRLSVCTTEEVLDFYCYESLISALEAYTVWDGTGEAPGPWVRHFLSHASRN